jgi:hypothetical protein
MQVLSELSYRGVRVIPICQVAILEGPEGGSANRLADRYASHKNETLRVLILPNRNPEGVALVTVSIPSAPRLQVLHEVHDRSGRGHTWAALSDCGYSRGRVEMGEALHRTEQRIVSR